MKKSDEVTNEKKIWSKANLVSRRILTSNIPEIVHIEAGIDKIALSVPGGLDIFRVMKRAEKLYPCRTKRLKEGNFLVVGTGKRAFFCRYFNFEPFQIVKVYFNPNYYSCFDEYQEYLVLLFGSDVMNWKVERIDFCLDFYVPYPDLMLGLDIKRKYKVSTFQDHQKTTGVHIGGGDDKFSIYCKTTENKNRLHKNPKFEHVDVARIERQMSGKKVPVSSLRDFSSNYSLVIEKNIFGQLELFQFELKTHLLNKSKTLIRRVELAVLIKHIGFFSARKHLNSNKNFDRDYGDLFRKLPFPADYQKAFSDFIVGHFSKYATETSLEGRKA